MKNLISIIIILLSINVIIFKSVPVRVSTIYRDLVPCCIPIQEDEGLCADHSLIQYLSKYAPDISHCELLQCYYHNQTEIKNELIETDGRKIYYYVDCNQKEPKTCVSWKSITGKPSVCLQLSAQLSNNTILTTINCGYHQGSTINFTLIDKEVEECSINFISKYSNWIDKNQNQRIEVSLIDISIAIGFLLIIGSICDYFNDANH